MRKKIIVGNWKMNINHLESIALVQKLSYRLDKDVYDECDIVVCPSFTSLRSVQTTIDSDNMRILLGAQTVNENDKGAFTGEVSSQMLKKLNVSHCLVGHSERRSYFSETNESIALKLKALRKNEITPILCVGETLEQRENGEELEIVATQVRDGLDKVSATDVNNCIIAYEPVWAIGAKQPATIMQASEIIHHIRNQVELISRGEGENIRVIYGASVDASNAKGFLEESGIDGLLVGGASLDADDFARLILSSTNKLSHN